MVSAQETFLFTFLSQTSCYILCGLFYLTFLKGIVSNKVKSIHFMSFQNMIFHYTIKIEAPLYPKVK